MKEDAGSALRDSDGIVEELDAGTTSFGEDEEAEIINEEIGDDELEQDISKECPMLDDNAEVHLEIDMFGVADLYADEALLDYEWGLIFSPKWAASATKEERHQCMVYWMSQGNTPASTPPGGATLGGVTHGGITPGGITLGGVTPGGITPGDVTPGGVTPGARASGSGSGSGFCCGDADVDPGSSVGGYDTLRYEFELCVCRAPTRTEEIFGYRHGITKLLEDVESKGEFFDWQRLPRMDETRGLADP
ncbi:hypothetical protein GOP47_0002991 [Adiantum capillus-veneris]|uniref:Uncharacterized protein n=1 Tax=Adiantum capillus-veneris TaxID=13818 RepID=A0A9D4VBL0_ADICA|nr:hypothetical protein GOP47_0002991 [Adiantum capillus-veneris]